jgi:AcrR family transcriptional regulator
MAILEKRTRDDPRRRETELAFLRATEALLEEGASFADLNVSRIATRAKRTRTAFYAHFTDRRDLLLRLVEEFGGELVGASDPFWTGPATRADIEHTIGDLLAGFRAHRTLVRAIVEAAGYDEEIATLWNGVIGRFTERTRARLEAEGHAPASAHATALALVWMTERTGYQRVVAGAGPSDAAIVTALTDIWAQALGAA